MSTPTDRRKTRLDFTILRDDHTPPQKSTSLEPKRLQVERESTRQNKRSGPLLQKPSQKVPKSALRDLSLYEVVSSGEPVDTALVVRNQSPWHTFSKIYSCELAGSVTVVEPRLRPSALLALREFPKTDHMMGILKRVRHENIISARECFTPMDSLYAIFEHQPVSLNHLVACRKWPNETQLASILAQVLDGLSHLVAEGLEHGSLACSCILVGYDGQVKIARLEDCRVRTMKLRDLEFPALGIVMMELMEKAAKEDGAIGVNDLQRWRSDCEAVDFLSATTSANSTEELKKHPFLTKQRWGKGYLLGLVAFALISTRTFYSNYD